MAESSCKNHLNLSDLVDSSFPPSNWLDDGQQTKFATNKLSCLPTQLKQANCFHTLYEHNLFPKSATPILIVEALVSSGRPHQDLLLLLHTLQLLLNLLHPRARGGSFAGGLRCLRRLRLRHAIAPSAGQTERALRLAQHWGF